MGLTNVEQALLIILASALALFLILAIVSMVYVIKLIKSLRQITEKAEKLVESAEAVGSVFKNASGPLAVITLIRNIVGMVHHNKKGE